MTEHTPSMAEIRDSWGKIPHLQAQFDRALAAHDAEVREEHESETAARLSLLLWHLTGGRLSKSTYDVPTMVAQIEDTFSREQAADIQAGVVAEEPEGRRWYAACYSDGNGTYHELESATVSREYAEAAVKRWKSIEEGEPNGRPDLVVLGTKIEHPWVPVKQERAQT